MDGIKEMEGRKIYLETSSNRKYSGIIANVDLDLSFIKLIDKFGETIWINFSEIKVLQEEKQ